MPRSRRRWANNYERMAYIALELLTENKTMVQLAEELGLSHQRIYQINTAALARTGCTRKPDVVKVGAWFRQRTAPQPLDGNHVETFTHHELLFRGKYAPWNI